MLKLLMTTLILSSFLSAGALTFVDGTIKAHTEVFGDAGIDPFTTKITSDLSIGSNLTQLNGKITIPSISLLSENEDRDEHMHEAMHVEDEKFITLTLTQVQKLDNVYEINADLTLNGVTKQIVSTCKIQEDSSSLKLDGNFSIEMTDYNIEQPSMLFFTVRDRVDVQYNFKL